MRYLDEYRDPVLARRLLDELHATATQPWAIMEVCGGQTNTLVRQGIDELLPAGMRMIHGPGCPVCVTPLEMVDKAVRIAARPDVIFTSYGDMLRVPGTSGDLLGVKARGGDVRVVYTPLDAVRLAERTPDRQVVFFAVGFETTAPANAMAVLHAAALGLTNFSVLVRYSRVRIAPSTRSAGGTPEDVSNHRDMTMRHLLVMVAQDFPPVGQNTTLLSRSWSSALPADRGQLLPYAGLWAPVSTRSDGID